MRVRSKTPLLEDLRLVGLGAAPLGTVLLLTFFQHSLTPTASLPTLSLAGADTSPATVAKAALAQAAPVVLSPSRVAASLDATTLAQRATNATPATTIALAGRLGARSDQIVIGRIQRAAAQSTGPGGEPGIHTLVEIQVTTQLKGSSASTLAFWVHGGRLGTRARRVTGQAQFAVGEEVAVFLRRTPGGTLWPTEMAQGKWAVQRAASELLLRPATLNLPMVSLVDIERSVVSTSADEAGR